MINPNDIVHETFGRLFVVNYAGIEDDGIYKYHVYGCRCECGTAKTVKRANLLNGGTTSCGCLRAEKSGRMNKGETKLKPYMLKELNDLSISGVSLAKKFSVCSGTISNFRTGKMGQSLMAGVQ